MKCKILSGILVCFCSVILSAHGQFEEATEGPLVSFSNLEDCYLKRTEPGILIVEHPNRNFEARILPVTHKGRSDKYLKKHLVENGISETSKMFESEVDGRKVFGVFAACTEMRKPVRFLFLALPIEDGSCVLRFKCPEECFIEHSSTLQELISSIKISTLESVYPDLFVKPDKGPLKEFRGYTQTISTL